MIVITIILILASIAGGRYEKSVLRAKEATLKQDLFVMRQAIQQFTLDKQAAPTSLDDLVQSKYMSAIPKDPMTNNPDWHTDSEDVLLTPEQTTFRHNRCPFVFDCHLAVRKHALQHLVSPPRRSAYGHGNGSSSP